MTVVIAIRPGKGRPRGPLARVWRRRSRKVALRVRNMARRQGRSDAGMVSAEYAVGTLGACAFAFALYKVVTSDGITAALTDMLVRALHGT
ncbi:DUF4244 domain-containing protein [Kitasatospora brasiliensis]|uniref:DUF4244 domain-containing protein n=1 Tax=Kitasatospora brasiliensis TaxID=3058040 RepID=UPI00292E86FA|nr:DUF4244 domain-containing protein [Kitasatospora sp. K002]